MTALQWCDENLPSGSYYADWTPFEHPQLGTVEIGGWRYKFVVSSDALTHRFTTVLVTAPLCLTWLWVLGQMHSGKIHRRLCSKLRSARTRTSRSLSHVACQGSGYYLPLRLLLVAGSPRSLSNCATMGGCLPMAPLKLSQLHRCASQRKRSCCCRMGWSS